MNTMRRRGEALLIDDYPPNILVATIMLENLGFTVDAVNCGEAALEILQTRPTPYTIILIDVQMQEMDGLETTGHIRALENKKGFRQPILGVTAHALAGDRARCLAAGMDEYLSKPIHPESLGRMLDLLVDAA